MRSLSNGPYIHAVQNKAFSYKRYAVQTVQYYVR